MGGKFDVPAGKQKTCRPAIRDGLLARLGVLVGRLVIRNARLRSLVARLPLYGFDQYL